MRKAKKPEGMSALARGHSSPARSTISFAFVLALACVLLQGCFLFQQPAGPSSRQRNRIQRAAVPPRTPLPPAIEEEALPPEPEIEGPPLPPKEDEVMGPPAPAPSESLPGGEQAVPMPQEGSVQEEARVSARTAALLAGLTRKGLASQASSRGVVIVLPESVFEYGTADLPKPSKRRLHDIASVIIEQASGVPVSVEGHTDSIGADLFNQGLSQRRAKAVAAELAAGGIAERLLRSAGFGSRFPIAPNEHPDGSDDPEGRARNRRVEIVIETEAASRG